MFRIFIDNNLLYAEHNINIDFPNELPVHGSVVIILLVHNNSDENNVNVTKPCLRIQATETDKIPEESEICRVPEHRGVTGSSSLIEKIHKAKKFI